MFHIFEYGQQQQKNTTIGWKYFLHYTFGLLAKQQTTL